MDYDLGASVIKGILVSVASERAGLQFGNSIAITRFKLRVNSCRWNIANCVGLEINSNFCARERICFDYIYVRSKISAVYTKVISIQDTLTPIKFLRWERASFKFLRYLTFIRSLSVSWTIFNRYTIFFILTCKILQFSLTPLKNDWHNTSLCQI